MSDLLPDVILQNIFSFLEQEDLHKITIIDSHCKKIINTVPCLLKVVIKTKKDYSHKVFSKVKELHIENFFNVIINENWENSVKYLLVNTLSLPKNMTLKNIIQLVIWKSINVTFLWNLLRAKKLTKLEITSFVSDHGTIFLNNLIQKKVFFPAEKLQVVRVSYMTMVNENFIVWLLYKAKNIKLIYSCDLITVDTPLTCKRIFENIDHYHYQGCSFEMWTFFFQNAQNLGIKKKYEFTLESYCTMFHHFIRSFFFYCRFVHTINIILKINVFSLKVYKYFDTEVSFNLKLFETIIKTNNIKVKTFKIICENNKSEMEKCDDDINFFVNLFSFFGYPDIEFMK